MFTTLEGTETRQESTGEAKQIVSTPAHRHTGTRTHGHTDTWTYRHINTLHWHSRIIHLTHDVVQKSVS